LNEAVLDSVEDRLVRKTYAEAITTTLAALRGLAMLRVVREQEVDAAWPATRRQLLSLYEPLLERTR
jgi:hypothetical protein